MGKITRLQTVTCVRFFDTGSVLFFGSLSAIYDYFDETEIGATLNELWGAKIYPTSTPLTTSKCEISKHWVYRKTNNSK